ncbi:MAG TPA: SAM-dependent methyltransferase [Elusimicrobiales bacterium]|nr:SAM-dependent methyltransferase [Elusimicrobiales bacterium]
MNDPRRLKTPSGQLLICGLGLRQAHLTAETLQTLKRSDVVFHDFLDERAEAYMRTFCPDLRDLRKLRLEDNSEAMADVVLAALAPRRVTTFMCYGHPMVLQGTADVLIRRCRADGIVHQITPSLSALDEIFVAAGIPVTMEGLQIYPSHVLIRRKVPLSPRLPAIVMVLDKLWSYPDCTIAGLVKHLKTIYPPGHPALLIRCRRIINDPLLRVETTISGLAGALKKLPAPERFNTSMCIPALGQNVKKDK